MYIYGVQSYSGLSCLETVVILLHKTWIIWLSNPTFDFESIWLRLFHRFVILTKLNISTCTFLFKCKIQCMSFFFSHVIQIIAYSVIIKPSLSGFVKFPQFYFLNENGCNWHVIRLSVTCKNPNKSVKNDHGVICFKYRNIGMSKIPHTEDI